MEKQNVVDEQRKKKVYLKANTKQTCDRSDKKNKARFISYIFFEVLFQNLKKKNISAGGSFCFSFQMFDHNFFRFSANCWEMQRDVIQNVKRFLLL